MIGKSIKTKLKNIKRLFNKKNKSIHNSISSADYYNNVMHYTLTRDQITGSFGIDVHKIYIMILWVIPGSPAERAGLMPRDLIMGIDDIYIQPGDTWHADYMLQNDTITITVLPTKLVFQNPALTPRLINRTSKRNDQISITEEYVNTLSLNTPGILIDTLEAETVQNLHNLHYSEVYMQDRVYI